MGAISRRGFLRGVLATAAAVMVRYPRGGNISRETPNVKVPSSELGGFVVPEYIAQELRRRFAAGEFTVNMRRASVVVFDNWGGGIDD